MFLINRFVSSLSGNDIASCSQKPAHLSHMTTQLFGSFTSAFSVSSFMTNTPFAQVSRHVPQPMHLSASMCGLQGIFSRGIPMYDFPAMIYSFSACGLLFTLQ